MMVQGKAGQEAVHGSQSLEAGSEWDGIQLSGKSGNRALQVERTAWRPKGLWWCRGVVSRNGPDDGWGRRSVKESETRKSGWTQALKCPGCQAEKLGLYSSYSREPLLVFKQSSGLRKYEHQENVYAEKENVWRGDQLQADISRWEEAISQIRHWSLNEARQ